MTPSQLLDRLSTVLSECRNQRVLVLGDAILDEYLLGNCGRLSPEAPVPVLHVTSTRQVLGGAANTAANIVSLGGQAILIALIGDDEGGATLRRCAAEAGVDLRGVSGGTPTLRKTRVVGQQQQIVRLDYEEVRPPSAETCDRIRALAEVAIAECDIVVISDYAKGFLSVDLARSIIAMAHEAGRKVIVDPRPQHRDCYVGCDYLTPNWRESRGLLGWADAEASAPEIEAVATALATGLKTNVVLTLGPGGMSFCGRDGQERFALPTLAKEVFDVSGAGDTVVAALALALAAGSDHSTALDLANRAASVAVGKFGTATVSGEEVLRESETQRLVPRKLLASLASSAARQGSTDRHDQRIVRPPAQRAPAHPQRSQATGGRPGGRPEQRCLRQAIQGSKPPGHSRGAASGDVARPSHGRLRAHFRRGRSHCVPERYQARRARQWL